MQVDASMYENERSLICNVGRLPQLEPSVR